MLLRRVLISKRMEMRILAAAIGQAAEMALSENAGVVSDALGKTLGRLPCQDRQCFGVG